MKINNITKSFGAILLASGMMACSSDYLDLTPDFQVSAGDVTESESALTLATYGLCRGMYCQYGGGSWSNWYNGEPMWQQTFGEAPGQDFVFYFWEYRGRSIPQWTAMDDNSSQYDYQGWMYCYYLISTANNILPADNDKVEGEVAFRMAEAYTIRAHAYVHLLQMYGPRWQDSNNGQALSVVLRLLPTAEEPQDSPLVSMNEVLNQIYSDLDRALELYQKSGWLRDYLWEPDIEVAYGVYARAALLKNDWQKAYNMAKNAMATSTANIGAGLMSIEEYEYSPFNEDYNPEFLWGSSNTEQNLYWWSSYSITGVNGGYTTNWAILGAGAVNYDLYKQVYNPNDVRCQRFFTPDKVSEDLQSDFWNGNVFQPLSGLTINLESDSKVVSEYKAYNAMMTAKIGRPNGFPNGAYTTAAGKSCNIPFGAHYKFWCNSNYGSGTFPYMRYSEMLLTAAEAAYQLGNGPEAQSLIDKLQENRIEGYTSPALSGEALYDYIKLVRRWELWGEGFNFFDFKRWNQPIVRTAWVEGDTNSGNWDAMLKGTLNTSDNHGWKWVVPEEETNYNNAVSPSNN